MGMQLFDLFVDFVVAFKLMLGDVLKNWCDVRSRTDISLFYDSLSTR